MDKDVEDIRRRAGLKEVTYTLGKQQTVDELVDNEVEFLRKTAAYLNNMRKSVLGGRVLHTQQVNQGIAQLMHAIANRMEALGEYRDQASREE